MDIQESWEKALRTTEIIRPRIQPLLTFETTRLPYIFLAESSLNIGDTVVRKGEIIVEKPSLFIPNNHPQFQGFEFEEGSLFGQEAFLNFLLIRGVTFPSLKYNNKTHSLDVYESGLQQAIDHHLNELQRQEDVHTGLVAGTEDCWQFSVLVFICSQVAKSAEVDIKRLLEEYKKKGFNA